MIAYLDSSAIVKLYNAEDGSEIVRTLLHEADFVATCMAAYPEVRSALARGFREGLYDEGSHRQKVSVFLRDWSRFQKVALAPDVIFLSGDLAERCALRGFDSIHLASAVSLREKTAETLRFACWDGRLAEAAKQLGFTVIP